MTEILLLYQDAAGCLAVEERARACGFRIKLTDDLPTAERWLRAQRFDGMCIDARVKIAHQEEFAGLLWKKNPVAPFVVYDFNQQSAAQHTSSRLFGADLAVGRRAKELLERSFAAIQPSADIRNEEFGILVVDDLAEPLSIICMFIQSLGFSKVKGVYSVKEAREELTRAYGTYSCVVTDLRMPEQSGVDLVKYVRNDERLARLPIIVLTAFGTADALIECIKAGASGFLAKPPSKQSMLNELHRAKRILTGRSSPRLVASDQVGAILDALERQGLV